MIKSAKMNLRKLKKKKKKSTLKYCSCLISKEGVAYEAQNIVAQN